jgi:hypothetical protein
MSRIRCGCGSDVLETSYKKHVLTIKHITFEQRVQEQVRQSSIRVQEQVRQSSIRVQEQVRQSSIRVQPVPVRVQPVPVRVQPVRLVRVKEQIKMLHMYETKKKEEEDRVKKRGIPLHIVKIVLEHSHEKNCMICLDDVTMENVFMTKCGHIMCKGCERKMYDKKNSSCPTCRCDF